ncbi:MAG TPA: GntR family transcriptional regulator [Anaerolineales bacterium]
MKASSLAEMAYIAIKKDILTCRLAPGSQIAQSQLVERYEFGVTPIREALKRLESEDYLRSVPRFGYIINPITIQDIEDIYELRLLLETSAVRLAIQRGTDDDFARLKESAEFTYIFKDPDSYLEFLQHNIGFHVEVAALSGNRKLAEMLSAVLNEMTRIFNLGLDLRDSAEEMRREHQDLVEALIDRDEAGALQQITEQIQTSRQRVMEEFSERIDQRIMTGAAF